MTREEAKDVFLNRGFIEAENCRERIFRGDKWREACVVISEWLKEEQKWVPASERLPESNGYYLVTEKSGRVYICVFHKEGNFEEYWKRCIVAWMPLPEPYKTGSEE